MIASQTKREKVDSRTLSLDMSMFAIVFTITRDNKIEKIESFMPPYEELAPHVYMFVTNLSILSRNKNLMHKILEQTLNKGFSETENQTTAIQNNDSNASYYQKITLQDNQVAMLLIADESKNIIKQSLLFSPSFKPENFSFYLFVKHLCQKSKDESFFQKVTFEGFNTNLFDSIDNEEILLEEYDTDDSISLKDEEGTTKTPAGVDTQSARSSQLAVSPGRKRIFDPLYTIIYRAYKAIIPVFLPLRSHKCP